MNKKILYVMVCLAIAMVIMSCTISARTPEKSLNLEEHQLMSAPQPAPGLTPGAAIQPRRPVDARPWTARAGAVPPWP